MQLTQGIPLASSVTAANVNDVVEANSLLHGQETDVFADAGYQGAAKRPDAKDDVNWHVAMRPGKRRALDKTKTIDHLIDQVERIKASVRAKVEHPFRVIKQQFGHVKVRYRGLKKNTAQLRTLFALSNLWANNTFISRLAEHFLDHLPVFLFRFYSMGILVRIHYQLCFQPYAKTFLEVAECAAMLQGQHQV